MKKILLLTLFALCGFYASAQTNITGTLNDDEGALPTANVQLHRLSDMQLIGGAVTNDDGSFTIKNVQKGNYMIKISYIGYQDYSKKINISGTSKEFKIGVITLKSGIMLQGAKVIGKATAVTVKGDTIEYNPTAYKLQDNAVVEDLLKKLPGVEVDKSGTITAGGKEVTKVLLGGKEFFGSDPTVATKNLPVKIVDKVQVLDRKSEQERLTGIADGEEETVINLEIKKGQQQGWMGNIEGGAGRDIQNASGNQNRYNANGMVNRFTTNSTYALIGNYNNINAGRGGRHSFGGESGDTKAGSVGFSMASYATDRFTVEASGMFNYMNNNTERTSAKQTFLVDSSFYTNSSSTSESFNRNFNPNVRLTYKPNDKNTFIFRPNFSYSNSESYGNSTTEILDGNSLLVNNSESRTSTNSESKNYGIDVDYSHAFNDKGRRLSLSFGVSNSNADNDGFSWSRTQYLVSGIDSVRDIKTNSSNSNFAYNLGASYVEPLSKKDFLQFSYNFSSSNRDQDKYTYGKDAHGNYTVLDSALSNSYKNDYLNQRFHMSYRRVTDKYNFQIGINVNPQTSESVRYIAGVRQNKQSRSVTNIGPMARFEYKFSKSHNLRVEYRTQTGQPSLTQLDPLRDISNPLSIRYGNPDLKPSYTHRLEVRYNLNNRAKMRTLTYRMRASMTQNSIVSKSFYNDDGVQEYTYDNLNGVWSVNNNLMVNFPLNTYFQLNSSSSVNFSQNMSFSNGEKNKTKYSKISPNLGVQFSTTFMDLGVRGTIGFTNSKNSISSRNDQSIRDYDVNVWTTIYLPLDFTIVSDFSYKDGSGYAAGIDTRQRIWNAGVQKSVFKNLGIIKFSINDILRDKKNISYNVTDNYIQQSINNTLNCYFMVSFIYRFNIFGGKQTSGDGAMPGGGGMGGMRPPRF